MDQMKIGAEEIYLAPETMDSEDVPRVSEDLSNEKANEDIVLAVKEQPKEIVRVGENVELRGENRKVYRMSDGTEQAVFYARPVHVFNSTTEMFDEVDGTLVEEEDGRHFVNGSNRFIAKFSREAENDELFSIESGMHCVTVSAKKNRKQRNKGVMPKLRKKSAEDFKKTDCLVFEGVQDGSDYEYSVNGNGVKENIIVKEKADVYRYSFVLRQENVTAKFDEESKRISFISNENGEEVFCIPAPFMTDANGVASTAVEYELKFATNGDALLNVTADSEWVNANERVFPIVIDPQIQLVASVHMTTYSWKDGNLYNSVDHVIGKHRAVSDNCDTVNRMYMGLTIPSLPRNPRIKKAQLTLFQKSAQLVSQQPKIGLYEVTGPITIGNSTPYHDTRLMDFAVMQNNPQDENDKVKYVFDITTLVDKFNKNETYYQNFVLKAMDESSNVNDSVTFYGTSDNSGYAPELVITYESTYGVNTSYRTHTHDLGRFGQGSIDLQCGNLMFESEDFAWSGNRMPVTIKHLYNSALSNYQYTKKDSIKLHTADFSAMKLGYGFKLNVMQSMTYRQSLPIAWTEAEINDYTMPKDGYVYIGENGEETYFKSSATTVCCDSNSHCYNLYEDVNGGGMVYDPEKRTLQQGDDTYQFDTSGRLIEIKDKYNNNNHNQMLITYTSNRITSVTDGAGREFTFAYSNGFLTSITAPYDNTRISYAYSDNLLRTITYPDGKKATLTYLNNKPITVTLSDTKGNAVYKVDYSYIGDRLSSVTEYGVENGNFVKGNRTTYLFSAASNRTLVQTIEQAEYGESDCYENTIRTVYTFDDDGNVTSQYVYSEDIGNVGFEGEESGIHPHSGDGGIGVVSNINNLLLEHNRIPNWSERWCSVKEGDEYEDFYFVKQEDVANPHFGRNVLCLKSDRADYVQNGAYQSTVTLPIGSYTFSVYLRIDSALAGNTAGAYIRVLGNNNEVLAQSDRIRETGSEYVRLTAPFELASAQSVQVQILMDGKGVVYANAPQLENNPYANPYNMLENGNFELGQTGWNTSNSGVHYTSSTRFNMSRSLMMTGSLEEERTAHQYVFVKKDRSARETFTLSGWAKGFSLPNHGQNREQSPIFRLRAVIRYLGFVEGAESTEEYTADFCPCTDEWQLASVQFSKQQYRPIQDVIVYCEYGYNAGTVYFDNIQLVRDQLETDLTESDFVIAQAGELDEQETTEQSTPDTAPAFEEKVDGFGNKLTETTFTYGEFGTIYRSFRFNADNVCMPGDNSGNDLVVEIDARGNETTYEVDEDASRNEAVIDRCGNKTAYEYDVAGKATKVTSAKPKYDVNGNKVTDDNGNVEYEDIAHVSYTYDAFDNMTEIVRGDGMKYVLKYNAFHNLESIGVDGKTDGDLIRYTYKNGNGRLKEMAYANGDRMTATYNGVGQMIAEKWYNASNMLTAHYKYVYDGKGNIVRSIDILAKKEYNYMYEEDKLVCATEHTIVVTGEIVTSKTLVNTVRYWYDGEGKMTKKVITPANGSAQTIYYEPTDDNTVVKFNVGGKTVTAHSKTDSFGRKVFDELQLGTGCISRQFRYHEGEITDEHKNNDLIKSTPTTQLVSQLVFAGGRTISYEYDAEERITEVDDSVEGITQYTYDALGQLVTETVNGITTKFEYDNYGNIKAKGVVDETGEIAEATKITYAYGDEHWHDLLTAYNGQSITYDAQGNPLSYLGHTLTWEKGRQLKSFDGNIYTYNANGIRISKTVGGIRHDFVLDGAKILREEWTDCDTKYSLIPLYDNEDSVCGIEYNGAAYYFLKNLQGDVIAITDKNGGTIARYTYDAWGKLLSVTDANGNDITATTNIAHINPFRYRGYYYDEETKLYYLQSRYYDPYIARFLNSDDAIVIISITLSPMNQFAYCKNNCIMNNDPTGYWYSSLSHFYNVNVSPWSHSYRTRSLYLHNLQRYQSFVDKHNTNVRMLGRFTNYIESQNKYPISTLKFGSKTISWCGCELIAIYNVMKKLSKWSYFADVINECYMNGLAMLDGYFGIWPPTMRKYFNAHKISYKYFGNAKKFFSAAVSAKISIVSYWNGKPYLSSLHTVAFHPYRTKNNTSGYYAYNYRNSKAEMKTLEELKRRKFICGYIFSK